MSVGERVGGRRRRWPLSTFLTVIVLASCSNAVEPLVLEAPASTSAPSTLAPTPTGSTPEPIATSTPDSTPAQTLAPAPNVAGVVVPPAPASVAAYRIEIPRLGINLPIAEGDVPRDVDRAATPNFYAFHLPGTSMFGAGNTYIYAHARVGMFLTLWDARVGDVVIVRTPGATHEYVVAEVHPRVAYTEVSWTRQTQDTRLTLQTSTGPNGTDPRFVVVARPVS